jgi:hypothetical protein
MKAHFRILLVAQIATLSISASTLDAQDAQFDRSKIKPPDVFVRVELIRDDLELVRFVMGRPKNKQPEIAVKNAEPREVYFQAQSLFGKANRLSFEHTRDRAKRQPIPTGEILPGDVYQIVDAALTRIQLVKKKLGITKESVAKTINPEMTANHVFISCVQASRQLNLLLEQRFAPSDVFLQVTRGVSYASRLLEPSTVQTLPPPPVLEPGKRPRDVYLRLIGCFGMIREIALKSNLKVLELEDEGSRKAAENADPSDVYDIALLVVSELQFLHSHLENAKAPREVFFAGRKFPSHVYQRTGILEAQLMALEAVVEKNPKWLGQSAEVDDR